MINYRNIKKEMDCHMGKLYKKEIQLTFKLAAKLLYESHDSVLPHCTFDDSRDFDLYKVEGTLIGIKKQAPHGSGDECVFYSETGGQFNECVHSVYYDPRQDTHGEYMPWPWLALITKEEFLAQPELNNLKNPEQGLWLRLLHDEDDEWDQFLGVGCNPKSLELDDFEYAVDVRTKFAHRYFPELVEFFDQHHGIKEDIKQKPAITNLDIQEIEARIGCNQEHWNAIKPEIIIQAILDHYKTQK